MLQFTKSAQKAESNIKVRTTLINVPESAMVTAIAFLFDKIRTYFEIMTEITLFTIDASAIHLKFIAGLNFAFIMRVLARVSLSTFTVNEFFANTIGGKLKSIITWSIALRLYRLRHGLIDTVKRSVSLRLRLVARSIDALIHIIVSTALLSRVAIVAILSLITLVGLIFLMGLIRLFIWVIWIIWIIRIIRIIPTWIVVHTLLQQFENNVK